MALIVDCATRPREGETVCGDVCGWWSLPDRFVLAVADGLGHGPEAAYAALAAMDCIEANLAVSCEEMFAECDKGLRNTRGAALAIAVVEPGLNRIIFGAVGNIRALLLRQPSDLRLGSVRGIVGAGYGRFVPEILTWLPGNVLVMFSDGIDEFFSIREYFCREDLNPQKKAQAVLDRWARRDDDAAVLIYQHETCHG